MWALFAAGAFVVAFVCYLIMVAFADKNRGIAILFGFMTVVVGLCGMGCVAVALIRFVKWVWGS